MTAEPAVRADACLIPRERETMSVIVNGTVHVWWGANPWDGASDGEVKLAIAYHFCRGMRHTYTKTTNRRYRPNATRASVDCTKRHDVSFLAQTACIVSPRQAVAELASIR
jgi:hypothetical protein